jgi:DNA primase
LMAKARQHADQLRWNAALVRVGHLTQLNAEELKRRIRTVHGGKPQTPVSRSVVSRSVSRAMAIPGARARAERGLLGALLCEPSHWQDVQKSIHSDEFVDVGMKVLAQAMWDHYRNEGAIPLNEFLELLAADLKTQAVELATDAQNRDDLTHLIAEGVDFFRRERQRDEERNAVSDLKAGQTADEDALLRRLQEQAKRTDLTRSAR